ncbi:MAG: FixH family protein [Gemmatimonadaceae bacterium]
MKQGARWPIGVALVLAATVTANLVLYYVAGADPSFAVEPDYYAKAVAWDSTLAQAKRNVALGWRVSPTLSPFTARRGALLSLTLTDSSASPIADAIVKVSAFYNARADSVLTATLQLSATGYSATLPVAHAGEWELRFDVTRGREHFTSTTRVDVVRAAPGS